jgi:SIR2-like domain
MTATKIDEFYWSMITEAIRAKTCVPFLGAAVNVQSHAQGYEYKGLPLGPEVALRLLRELLDDGLEGVEIEELRHYAGAARAGWRLLGKLLANKVEGVDGKALQATIAKHEEYAHLLAYEKVERAGLDEDLKRAAIINLPRVAMHFGLKARWDYTYIKRQLEVILLTEGASPSKLLATLARLPVRMIVTTNYDRLMEKAFDDASVSYRVVVQPIEGFNTRAGQKRVAELAEFDGLILYKFHGEFGASGPAGTLNDGTQSPRIILTEEDYIEFLSVLGKDRAVPSLITERLADNTLLFLGYSLEDWDFRTMHKLLIDRLAKHSQRTSFAIQKDPPEFWVKYWESKKVLIYNIDLYEFADQLKERLERSH